MKRTWIVKHLVLYVIFWSLNFQVQEVLPINKFLHVILRLHKFWWILQGEKVCQFLKTLNLIIKTNLTDIKPLTFFVYRICFARNQMQQLTSRYVFTSNEEVDGYLDEWNAATGFEKNILFIWKNQTTSQFWLYHFMNFAMQWHFPRTLSLNTVLQLRKC